MEQMTKKQDQIGTTKCRQRLPIACFKELFFTTESQRAQRNTENELHGSWGYSQYMF